MVFPSRLDMSQRITKEPLFRMLHQLLIITAIAEQCFRLTLTRHVGLVEINIMPAHARSPNVLYVVNENLHVTT